MKALQSFNSMAKVIKGSMMMLALCLTGCASASRPNVLFAWGPIKETISAGSPVDAGPTSYAAITPPAPTSKAVSLRDDPTRSEETRALLLNGDLNTTPNSKDWQFRKGGMDKGPTILGVNMRFDLHSDKWGLRVGAVRRGANRTFGPQVMMSFGKM